MALKHLKVIEFAGLAPGPLAGLILADFGASVIRVDRPVASSTDVLHRGKRSLALELNSEESRDIVKQLVSTADVVIDPFRPGVLEKLGLGPDVFLGPNGLNPRLVFARLVGFPRQGPQAKMAGHDINYAALSGVLSLLTGGGTRPNFPINILADFGGGALMCVLGILLALVDRNISNKGQIVDTNMVSGLRYLSSFNLIHEAHSEGLPTNKILGGAAPFYDVYECSDGRWMSVGCLEPQFFAKFIKIFIEELNLPDQFWRPTRASQMDVEDWPTLRKFFEDGFKQFPQDHWSKLFDGTDACVVPILTPEEAAKFVAHEASGIPKAHPNLSRTPANEIVGESQLEPGQHNDEILAELGIDSSTRQRLVSSKL